MKEIKGGITAAKGFKSSSCAAGIKYKDRTDMAMVYSEKEAVCAGTFTTNQVKAACVKWDMLVNEKGLAQAIVVNSGIANACTGREGFAACESVAGAVSDELKVDSDRVIVASTGVIGMQLPVDKLVAGVKTMSGTLDDSIEAGTASSKAIMTTDTVNKEIAVSVEIDGKEVIIGGMCKGSGMIHPNMCTMLAFLGSDVAITKELLQEAVSEVVNETFNMITVDGDTSTNDTFMIMANGMSGAAITSKGRDYDAFREALMYVCRNLAMRMAADGEGATKLFEAEVVNAKSKDDARTLSKAIVGSALSKAAIFGRDANFGRFLCAMGYSGAKFDEADVELYFVSKAGKLKVFDHGVPLAFDEEEAVRIMSEDAVTVYVNMNEGEGCATAWGCDLTYDYVKINADYRS
ncbi:MAG: bifunctional glutamate N-acetyltransferase/amino-acid acetyltransferase ArgJ [Lachnospiraceae bacterium]|nr:bifunctional glutamate N-acetyltransferase/amino-acid acetyltransferase ArgJ [Lachnospiraceae bacterium]